MERNFDDWFSTFRENIATYDFYVDFKKSTLMLIQ